MFIKTLTSSIPLQLTQYFSINPASTFKVIFINPASTYTVFFYQLRVNFHGDFSSIPLPRTGQYFLQSRIHLHGDFSINTASDDNMIFSSIGSYSLITWVSQST